MANEYAEAEDLKKALSLTGENFADEDIARALEAASRSIDAYTGRRFWPDANANQVRRFATRSSGLLFIDDLIQITSLKSDTAGVGTFDLTWPNTAYVLGPVNAAAEGVPYTQIESRGGDYAFPSGVAGVEITGKFGWLEPPAQVKQATMILASKLVRRTREAPFGIVTGYDGGDSARISRTDPDVAMLIDPFRIPVIR